MSDAENRTVEASYFKVSRRVWQEEMNTGPDPYADPALWLGCTDAEDDGRGEN